MTATMKGVLKGLRYITRVFEDEKEPEMQIGNPTDVKHVAHIGCEGPSANQPSWVNQFKAPELARDSSESARGLNLKTKESKNKSRRKSSTGTDSPFDSPRRSSGSGSAESSRQSRKQSRRRKSKGSTGEDSTTMASSRGKDGDFNGMCPFGDLGTSKGS